MWESLIKLLLKPDLQRAKGQTQIAEMLNMITSDLRDRILMVGQMIACGTTGSGWSKIPSGFTS